MRRHFRVSFIQAKTIYQGIVINNGAALKLLKRTAR
jgi:hypothetical protein